MDNTLLVLMADNGASQEGGPFGVLHEMKFFNGILETPDQAIARLDDIGGPHSHTNYPWGWAQCGNTPFKWYKQNTHEGGVHVPMVVHWPAGIAAAQRGTKRAQFVNVADVAPTIYGLLGITPPTVFRGVEQLAVTGHSFAALLDDPAAPATNTLQYFEMAGSRAIVAGRWKAVCRHVQGADFDTEPWELYDLDVDASECHDLADAQPGRVADLVAQWWQEAQRHGVLPLDDRGIELFGARFRDRSPHPSARRYVYRPPMSPIPAQASAAIGGRSFDLTARITREPGEEGVLWATGTENSGISVFVQDDRLVVDYNVFDDHTVVASDVTVPTGDSVLEVRLRRGAGRSGTVELVVDDVVCGGAQLALFMRMISSVGSSIGGDHGSAVSPRYAAPFAFDGVLHEVVIELISPPAPDAADAAGACRDGPAMTLAITLLGTGSPLPSADCAGPSTLISTGPAATDEHHLVDAGRGVLMRLAAVGLGAQHLTSVLVTHLHSDHITDLNDVITSRWVMSLAPAPLTIVGPVGTRSVVDHILASLAPDIGYRIAHHADLSTPPAVDVVEVVGGRVDVPGRVAVTAAPTDHRPVEPSVGYRFDLDGVAVVVAGDTVPCAGLDELCAGAGALVHTAIRKDIIATVPVQRLQDTLDYHSSPEEAAQTAARAGVGTLVLTHYVPPIAPGGGDDWRALVAAHFDGRIELGPDLHRVEVVAAATDPRAVMPE